jgi:hypothetical protein
LAAEAGARDADPIDLPQRNSPIDIDPFRLPPSGPRQPRSHHHPYLHGHQN